MKALRYFMTGYNSFCKTAGNNCDPEIEIAATIHSGN